MWRAVVIVAAMVLLTINVEGYDALIGIASIIDGDTIEICGECIRLAARNNPHRGSLRLASTLVDMTSSIVRTQSS
jgi:hypothetical protein